MTEVFADPTADAGQSNGAPEADATEEVGGGILEPDKAPGDLDTASIGQTDEGAAEAGSGTTAGTTTVTNAGQGYRAGTLRQEDYTQKTMDLAEERRAFQEEQRQWREEQQQNQQTFQQQQQQHIQALQNPEGQQAPLSQQLRNVMDNPELSAQDRAGLGVMVNLSSQVEEQQSTIAQLQQQLGQVAPLADGTAAAVNQMTSEHNDTRTSELQTQIAEADRLFGQGSTEQSKDFIHRNLGIINPQTRERYTIAELVAWDTRKDVEAVRNAQSGNRQVRQASKQSVSANGAAHPAADASGGTISESQALAEIRATL